MTVELPQSGPDSTGDMWNGSYPLPNSMRSPGLARMLVRQALEDCPPDRVETAELLVSELVTNAVRHAETGLVLTISVVPRVRIAVDDSSSDLISARLAEADQDTGRGLAIVEALASAWGCESAPQGKRVWFEL